jgi:hypothetical protein
MNDDYDQDEEELSPALRAQLERLERSHDLTAGQSSNRRKAKLKARRQLEDWRDLKRIRDEFDYLS